MLSKSEIIILITKKPKSIFLVFALFSTEKLNILVNFFSIASYHRSWAYLYNTHINVKRTQLNQNLIKIVIATLYTVNIVTVKPKGSIRDTNIRLINAGHAWTCQLEELLARTPMAT